jgi:UDP-N-acetylmuramoyl-L-alanyl-D-glutamate--2,6-diaminopimelate ligase
MTRKVNIKEFLEVLDIKQTIGDIDKTFESIIFDSRKVESNCIFVAVKGTQSDGHQYIESSVEKGASIVLCEHLPEKLNKTCLYLQVEDSSYALGVLSHQYFGKPSENLKLIGVTGTNGKTTIATLLYQLFQGLGYKVGLLSTVENYIHKTVIKATHTTPDAIQINSLMADMVEAGCDYCFMEVSSHAIHQNRIAGLDFDAGIFTNITHDHLDYHHTFKEYIHAKKAFFDQLKPEALAITNADDKNGLIMLQNCNAKQRTYAVKQMADYKSKSLEKHFDGTLIQINQVEFWTKLIGDFNVYNLTAIIACANELGHSLDEILPLVSQLESVNGRFEAIRGGKGQTAIVDYAHTPDALQNVLQTINGLKEDGQTLICVVGAGGDRDASKRPEMAKIACTLANKVILTSDNPRNEEPEAILDDMEAGLDPIDRKKVLRITDRKQAINTAAMLAQKDDIILIAGKGHETYQDIKGTKHHFDDKEVIKDAFEN